MNCSTRCPSCKAEVELSEDEVVLGMYSCPECNLEVHIERGIQEKADSDYVLNSYLLTQDGEKCFSVSESPTVNRNCRRSVWFFLLGWGAFFLANKAVFGFGLLAYYYQISLVATVIAVPSLLLSIWYSFRGLRESSREKRFKVGGRWRAALAMVLSLGVLGSFAFGAYHSRERRSMAPFLPETPGEWAAFPEENFRIMAPGQPWFPARQAIPGLPSATKLVYSRLFPDVTFMVVAEKVGANPHFTTQAYADLAKLKMLNGRNSFRITDEAPVQVKECAGRMISSKAEVAGTSLFYCHWFWVNHGFAYQIIAFGHEREQKAISGEWLKLVKGFEVLDPQRMADSPEEAFQKDYVSPRNAFEVKVASSPWRVYPDLAEDFPEAEFGASTGDCQFVVVPVFLAEADASLEALSAAFFSTMGIKEDDPFLVGPHPSPEQEPPGCRYEYQRVHNGTEFVYRFYILRVEKHAYFLAGWCEKARMEGFPKIQEAMSRVRFSVPVGKADSLAPLTVRERRTRGHLLNEMGLYYFRTHDYPRALALFREAVIARPEETTFITNALKAWSEVKRPEEALAFLSGLDADKRQDPGLRAWEAFLQYQSGNVAVALETYQKVFLSGYRDESDFSDFITLLLQENLTDQAMKEIDRFEPQGASPAAKRLKAEVFRKMKEYSPAIALYRELWEKSPKNIQGAFSLAEVAIEGKQYSEALEVCRLLLKNHTDSAYVWNLKGRAECGLKWYREAKTSFETSFRLAPADSGTRDYLNYVSGLLGEGNNSVIKEPIAPVPFPRELAGSLSTPVRKDFASEWGAYYPRTVVSISWKPGEELRTTEYLDVHVLDTSGVSAFSTIQVPFDPLSEDIHVNEVRVLGADGNTISTGTVNDYYVLDAGNDSLASQKKYLNIPVPGLQPGNEIHLVVTRRIVSRSGVFPFQEIWLSRMYPVRESIVFFQGNPRQVQAKVAGKMEAGTAGEGRYWRAVEPILARPETLQPPAAEFLPVLWLNGASQTWKAVAGDYLASISDLLAPDPGVEAHVRNLLPGLTSDEQRIAAISRHVQSGWTYKAIEFGRRAQIPHAASEILRNKYGDCKDHALLLYHLLNAAGIPARLALTNTNGPLQRDLPSLDQFNHMIVYLPGVHGGRFLDATDKGVDLTGQTPSGLAEKDVLVLGEASPEIVRVPPFREGDSALSARKAFQIRPNNDLDVEEDLTLTGGYAAIWRGILVNLSPDSRRLLFHRILGITEGGVSKLDLQGLDDPAKPLRLVFCYHLKRRFQSVNDRILGSIPLGMDRLFLGVEETNQRISPFELHRPLHYTALLTIAGPQEFRAVKPQEFVPKVDPRFGTSSGSTTLDGKTLTIAFDFQQKAGRFPASEYAIYCEAMKQVSSFLERQIEFTRR